MKGLGRVSRARQAAEAPPRKVSPRPSPVKEFNMLHADTLPGA
jgi:hypothetical protein